MLVIDRRTWWRQLLVWNGTALQRILPRLVLVTISATALTLIHELWFPKLALLTPLPFMLVGLPLGIFLGFRNNASYDRYWEGRRLWGQLVNECRSFARSVAVLLDDDGDGKPSPRQRQLVLRTAAFAHLLRQHLRQQDDLSEVAGLLDPGDIERIASVRHRPVAVLGLLGASIRKALRERAVDPFHVPLLEQSLRNLTDVLGGCERIATTPLPASYVVLIHRIVAVYVFSLPFGIMDTVHVLSPVVTMMIAYAFLGLDAIGDEIEHPFGLDPNDLPLSTISRNIEINLREMLGDVDLPQPLLPHDDILP